MDTYRAAKAPAAPICLGDPHRSSVANSPSVASRSFRRVPTGVVPVTLPASHSLPRASARGGRPRDGAHLGVARASRPRPPASPSDDASLPPRLVLRTSKTHVSLRLASDDAPGDASSASSASVLVVAREGPGRFELAETCPPASAPPAAVATTSCRALIGAVRLRSGIHLVVLTECVVDARVLDAPVWRCVAFEIHSCASPDALAALPRRERREERASLARLRATLAARRSTSGSASAATSPGVSSANTKTNPSREKRRTPRARRRRSIGIGRARTRVRVEPPRGVDAGERDRPWRRRLPRCSRDKKFYARLAASPAPLPAGARSGVRRVLLRRRRSVGRERGPRGRRPPRARGGEARRRQAPLPRRGLGRRGG